MQRSSIPLKVQQFDLFQPSPRGPDYRTLPLAVRQETVRLLACLLQAHQGRHPMVIPDREASDE
jgi:hypothetical protein